MEQGPHYESDLPADEAAVAVERFARIQDGLEIAWRRGRRIDDLTAKRIARELDPGGGPLHVFADTGAIPEGMDADLVTAEEVVQDLELDHEPSLPWITALREYFGGRLIRSAMPYWNDPSME
jgi:hypothetical protein